MENPSDAEKAIEEPLLRNPKGGFRTLPFIIVNGMGMFCSLSINSNSFKKKKATASLQELVIFGLRANMILYLTGEYGVESAKAAQIWNLWSAATFFTPIVGAFLADSYVGRYRMIGFGCTFSILGTVSLWLMSMIPQTRPPPCDPISNSCQSATTLQLVLLCSSFALMSIGMGGVKSSCMAFGADQLRGEDSLNHAASFERFFSWFYVSLSVSVLVGITCVTYIQDAMGWTVGFGVTAALMFFSAISFFLASPFYVKSEAKASLLTGFARVIVASFKNRSLHLPSQATDDDDVYYNGEGRTPSRPSETLRFLNKACVIRRPQEDLTVDGNASDPWSLCTIEQVEELKVLIKVIPIWSTGMLMSLNVCQNSLAVLQVSTMDRHITSGFEIPAGSFSAFNLLSVTMWVILYDRVIVPLASKINRKPTRLSVVQRMGIGILFSSGSMAAFAIVETVRRAKATQEGISGSPSAVVDMSAMWLLPHCILGGMSEAFNVIGQYEFYHNEFPRSMSSIAANLFMLGFSVANLLSSSMLRTVDDITGREGQSWISSDFNKGHYDYYYWILSALSLLNFIYYLACSKAYGPLKAEAGNAMEETEEPGYD